MSFAVEVWPSASYAVEAARWIAERTTAEGSLVLTGGGTAERIYLELNLDLSNVDVYFSDERCVPPDHEASNFALAERSLLGRSEAARVHRMRGEDSPIEAARSYHDELAPAVERGFDVMLLGMGDDNHIAALFPNSAALINPDALCLPVDRPDGLKGLTMTAPAIESARTILLIVTGESKAEAVERAMKSDDDPLSCPVRMLADHPDTTFLLDEAAALRL
ncbi:MAG TPA: 6-phosphogluconolactonase [Actinomycetota bacterium]|nr:6-phosphogluconolactonase [Actinomycetota bacterium]